jgi:hypothetical protein
MADALTVDSLAQEIRRVDGQHKLGAGALAEALMPFLERCRALPAPAAQPEGGRAHEIWAAAQLAPGEGIEDGVARIDALLSAPAAGEPEVPEPFRAQGQQIATDGDDKAFCHLFCLEQLRTYGDARAEHARRVAMEEAAKACESMHEEDRPGDYAYAVRALAAAQQGETR